MSKVKRKATRSAVGDLTVRLTLRDPDNGRPIAEPIHAWLDNISVTGASLGMTHIRTGDQHLFYAGKDSSVPALFLEVESTEAPATFLSVPVSPVWFNCEGSGDATIFRMGVEFVKATAEAEIVSLVKMACGGAKGGGRWFGGLFSKNICALTRGVMGRFCWRRRNGEG